MTGCTIITTYLTLLSDISPPHLSIVDRLAKAYELRTGRSFNDTIKKNGKYGTTIYRGLLFDILRYHYAIPLLSLRILSHYNCNQPIYRCMLLFESQLNIDPELKREYRDIMTMLSIH